MSLAQKSVGFNKAEQLAERLGKNFPHLSITGHPEGAHSLIDDEAGLLADSNLVVVATGNWDADSALNRWHLESGRKRPFLYGWAENYAAAGHAIVIGRHGGCLGCGVGSTGQPAFQATVWPDGAATLEEPACGNHFNPYGAVELGFVVDLIADTALEALLEPPIVSLHRMWLSQSSRLQAAGGNWSSHLLNIVHDGFAGGALLMRSWPDCDCRLCSRAIAA